MRKLYLINIFVLAAITTLSICIESSYKTKIYIAERNLDINILINSEFKEPILQKVEIIQEVLAEPTYQVGTSFLIDKATSYGVDCSGCSGEDDGFGGTAAGIQLSITSVLQSDGNWLDGITYDGYYLVAANKEIPFCTLIEISNHGWSGQGLSPETSFQALVVDRGGSVIGSDIDLYVGSQANPTVTNQRNSNTEVKILQEGTYYKNELGQWACAIQ